MLLPLPPKYWNYWDMPPQITPFKTLVLLNDTLSSGNYGQCWAQAGLGEVAGKAQGCPVHSWSPPSTGAGGYPASTSLTQMAQHGAGRLWGMILTLRSVCAVLTCVGWHRWIWDVYRFPPESVPPFLSERATPQWTVSSPFQLDWMASKASGASCLCSPSAEAAGGHSTSHFYMGAGLNSGLRASAARLLPAGPSLQTPFSLFSYFIIFDKVFC